MRWIKMSDRQPEQGQVCLVKSDYTYDGAGVGCAVFVGKYYGGYFDPSWTPANYTAWNFDEGYLEIDEVEVDADEAIAWMPWEDLL